MFVVGVDPSIVSNPFVSNEDFITNGYFKVNPRNYEDERDKAIRWLLESKDKEHDWGDDTSRVITALYLTDQISNSNDTVLVFKQFHIKILEALLRNQTEEINLSELALHIKGLSAICHNPSNFHGYDLLKTLRYRTDYFQESGKYVSPLIYITLCVNQASNYSDALHVERMINDNRTNDKVDMLSLLTMTELCLTRTKMYNNTRTEKQIARNLVKIREEFQPLENIYDLALVIQALNEAKVSINLWNRESDISAMLSYQNSNGAFIDVLGTYYALPILSGKSFISLSNHCPVDQVKGTTDVESLHTRKEQKISIQYSLYYGHPMEVAQSLRIKVGKSSNILDVMQIAEAKNPTFSFRYNMKRGKPFVYSIGGIVNDAEQGLYWTLHTSSRNGTELENLERYDGDIRHFFPTTNDHIVFWYQKIY